MERLITFESKAELEKALATQIALDLTNAIQQKGSATLLLSGGSTPAGVYQLLSTHDIDWNHVIIGLVDERFVAADSPFSNYKLLRETIATHLAKNAVIIPMVIDSDNYENNLKECEVTYRIFTEPDVCLLGMGPDGHTASIFPNDPASEEANTRESVALSNTNAPAEPTQRITLNGPVLRRTKSLYLMITGAQKKEIFDNSLTLSLPIAYFKEAIKATYYTPAP
jgi:6-phosphogluconolactonase